MTLSWKLSDTPEGAHQPGGSGAWPLPSCEGLVKRDQRAFLVGGKGLGRVQGAAPTLAKVAGRAAPSQWWASGQGQLSA